MFFQVLQDRLFLNGALKTFEFSNLLTHTWDYKRIIGQNYVECARIWAKGKSLDECCPEFLKNDWETNQSRVKAFLKSFMAVGLSPSNVNLVETVPQKFLNKYLSNINQISEHVFKTEEKPENYDFMLELHQMLSEISDQVLKIDHNFLKTKIADPYYKRLYKKLSLNVPRIAYNPYGTITGRLGVQSGSFPILNLAREARRMLVPNNHCFVELDFNAAELRVLLALSDKEQPDIDIHEWNAKNVFKQDLNRDEIKKKTFSWLYNPKAVDKQLDICYNKQHVLDKHYNGSEIETIFNRKIKSDNHHALNYLIQSTTSDLFLRQAIKIWKMLKGKKTNVAFTIHDSLVLDFHLSDKGMVERIIEEFSDTSLGKFKVNISGGRNFGEMKEMNL